MDSQDTKKILVVEDDEFLRDFYQELLSSEGYIVDIASDGEIAWNKIINVGNWSLILLDIMLPKKDGLQILRDLSSAQKTNLGPIIVLTNLGHDSIIKEAFSLGASGYLIKSAMNPDQVLIEVKKFLLGL